MGKRLTDNVNSSYFAAANSLRPKNARRRIAAYVESYDDILFWRTLLSEFEIYADKDMAWPRYLAKLGPMLGLMGTLIPMGPALVGLSTGDIGSMAYNMQVAFATTVVGIVSAAIGYFTEQVKQRWYLRDLTALQYLSDVLDGGSCNKDGGSTE